MEQDKKIRVDSPEQLNEYIKLTNPGVWVLVLAVAVLLAGVCVWAIFGKIDTKVPTVAVSGNGAAYLYVKEEDVEQIKAGMPVRINDNQTAYEIETVSDKPEKVTEDLDEYTRYIGNLQVGEWVYKCKLNKAVKEGVYGANIVIESISPMTFIVN